MTRIFTAQIAPFIYSKKKNSQGLRDAQRKVLNITQNRYGYLLDIGEENEFTQETNKMLVKD